MFLAFAFFVLLILMVFPDAPTAKAVHRLLIEPAARWLNSLSWMNLALAGAVIVGGVIMTLLFGAEGLRVYGMIATEGMMWLVVVDVTILIDLFVVGAAVTAFARVKAGRDHALLRLSTLGLTIAGFLRPGRARARRARPSAAAKPRRSDDPDPFGLAYAG